MEQNRALYWIGVVALIGFGFLIGQPAPVAIAASVAVFLAYEQVLNRSAVGSSAPSVRTS